jgi:hypothetical protein
MPLIRLALLLVLGELFGCAHGEQLRDQFTTHELTIPFKELLQQEAVAPVIVLGTVTSVTPMGGPQRSAGEPRILTELTQINIDVEIPIRGGTGTGPMSFYYFKYSSENRVELGRPTYVPEIGQRRIYFLKPWDRTYRTIGDVIPYNLPVRSGRHNRQICRGKQAGCCIAEILLTVEEDASAVAFVNELGSLTAYAAGELCSPGRAQELLQQLISNPDERVAHAASDIMTVLEQWWPQLKASR